VEAESATDFYLGKREEAMLRHFAAFSIAALSAVLVSGAQAQTKTANLGVVIQLTGSSATYGVGVQNAVEIARKELKDKGIIDLKVHYEDHQQQPQLAVQGFQKLVDAHDVKVVLANASPINLAIHPFAKERKVLVYNYNAVSPALRSLAPWIINGNPLADLDGKKLAEYMIKQGQKTAGVISQNSEFGEAVSKAFIDAYTAAGGKVVAHEVSDERVFDMRTQLLKIKNRTPQALVVFLNIPENGYTVAQAREIGLNAQIYANQFLLSPDNYKVAGDAMNGVQGVSPKFDKTAASAADFVKKFNAVASRDPQPSEALAYDGTRLIGEAIAAVGEDPQAIRKHILAVKDWPGAMGSYAFDSDGVALLAFEYYKIVDQKPVYSE
jgi:branched-chain amino acid transport system substrate-binding protein